MAYNILPRLLVYGVLSSQFLFNTLGLVRYTGSGPNDAKRVLDESQGVSGKGWPARGHPRGHASNPNGGEASVESYSRSGRKTAFMSREDQDEVVHHALKTTHAQRGMDLLNQGETRIRITLPIVRLDLRKQLNIGRWSGGTLQEQGPLNGITFLLQRPQNDDNNNEVDPQVFTCYPLLESVSESIVNMVRRRFGTHGDPIEIPAKH